MVQEEEESIAKESGQEGQSQAQEESQDDCQFG